MAEDIYANAWLVACSGGSTGRPKLIILNEPSVVAMSDLGGGRLAMPDGLSIEGGGVVEGVDLIPSPLSHNAPFHCAMHVLAPSTPIAVQTDAMKPIECASSGRSRSSCGGSDGSSACFTCHGRCTPT